MIYQRVGSFTYWGYPTNSAFIRVTNNEEKEMRLKSITLKVGKGAAGKNTSATNPNDVLDCSGEAFTLYLTYNDIETDGQYISNNCALVNSFYWSTSNTQDKTFTFSESIVIPIGKSITLGMRRSPSHGTNATNSGPVLVISNQAGDCSGSSEEPYIRPTIDINTSTIYSIYNESRSINIDANTSEDDSDTTVFVNINGNIDETDIGNNSSVYKFIPENKGVIDGLEYYAIASRVHSKNINLQATSKTLYLRTYRTPIIDSLNIDNPTFSGVGNAILNWNCNGRRWSIENESNFISQYSIGSSNWYPCTSQEPNIGDSTNYKQMQQQVLNQSIIDTCISASDRSKEKINTTIQIRRTNPTSKVSNSKSINTTIQFWPKYSVSNVQYSNPLDDNLVAKGSTNFLSDLPKVKVRWSYSDAIDRGVISGYIIKIFASDQATQVGSNYNVISSSLSEAIIFNTRTQLKRGELNYIEITPYYDKPDGSGRKYAPSFKQEFILPIGKLYKPVIDFPTNNSTWHNKYFRILLSCPEDNDFDALNVSTEEYRYENIELVIKPNIGNELIYTYLNNSKIFNTSSLTYKRQIVIDPSILSNFPEASSYSIKIRFQKKYYLKFWSEWSDVVNLNQSAIEELNIQKDTFILASQYKIVRDYSIRLWQVYHNSNETYSKDNIACKEGDIILGSNYQGIYDTILAIQNKVNNWGIYDSDKINLKFNQSINDFIDNKIKQEYITANKISNIPPGRNYKNILINCMNRLY